MKTFLGFLALTLSLNVSAYVRDAELNFSNVYGNTNVGEFLVKVEFSPKKTLSVSSLTNNLVRDDNDLYCVTSANFEIGEMNFYLVNKTTGWAKVLKKKITASVSSQSETSECNNDINQFAGAQALYATLGINEAITLPTKAPFDYETVGVHLAPFNGYLYLNANVVVENNKLVVDPSNLLTKETIEATNTTNESVSYFLFARKESSTLSLAVGLADFK